MPFDFGDIILVPFPFSNQLAFKKRPAVVVSNRSYNAQKPDLVMMAVTSQLRAPASFGEVWLADWQSANLLKPSATKPVFATIEQALILKTLGSLQPPDQIALRAAILAILG